MGVKTEYKCLKCDFIITDYDLNYFIDEETNCVVEHGSGRLTFNMGDGSKIKGKIIPSFCPDCSCKVHFYFNENEAYINEIKLALEQNETDFEDILDEKYNFRLSGSELRGAIGSKDKTHGDCPKCGKKIPLITKNHTECPKCGGKLFAFGVFLYD